MNQGNSIVNHMIPLLMWNNWHWFSSNRPTGPIQSSRRIVCVCVCVCLFVCPFSCNIFWGLLCPHFPKSDVQSFQRFGILGEKCWKEVVSELNFFVMKWSKIPAWKIFFFVCWFCPTKHGGNHASRWIRDLWSKGIMLILAYL